MVDNAVRFAPDGGHVTPDGARRSAGRPGSRWATTARASPPRTSDRVFDRLYQADPSRDRASGTSGLGLAIARAIAEAHGGRVGVENPPRGRRAVLARDPDGAAELTRPVSLGRPHAMG